MTGARLHGIGDESALVAYEGPVYHYTSGDGLLQIVSKGQLRVSEASSLNDVAEIKLGWKAVRKWLDENAKGNAGAQQLKRMVKRSPKDPKHQVFILSGTTSPDDANQWRLYADQGRGYAIEFDGAESLAVISLGPTKVRPGGPAFGRRVGDIANVMPWCHVLYDESRVASAMVKVAHYVEREVQRIDAIPDGGAKEHAYEALNEELMEELTMIAHLHKSSGFSGEKEVRIVARFVWFGEHVGYHTSRYGIAGHVNLIGTGNTRKDTQSVVPTPSMDNARAVGFQHPLPIRGVRLGPLVHRSNRKTVKAFLSTFGLSAAMVTKSRVPLR